MKSQFLTVALAVATNAAALAQGTLAVDLLDPSETSGTIPANYKIVDVHVDIVETDVWTAGGIRAITSNGAAFVYFDVDPNEGVYRPGLFNPGVENKFVTSLSKPRPRDGEDRFHNAGAAAATGYYPDLPVPITTANEFNVVHFASPPENGASPSVDGYVARVAVDVAGVGAPQGAIWGAGLVGDGPQGAVYVLRSQLPGGTGAPGTALTTWDVPQISGINWGMWYVVPEPTSLILLTLGGLAVRWRYLDRPRSR
ncbi:MAG: PEP-CTERM sorting domain-containing protein [Planctomycetes bacterium]|nr:PEP-CTERM sorting domain-containing protein [Planctomycetota bacterium]